MSGPDSPEQRSGATRWLAERVLAIRYEDFDAAAVKHAKMLLLDHIGCVLIGSTMPWSQRIYRYFSSFGGNPEARVANYGVLLTRHDAAFINAAFAQACEWDDYSLRSMGAGHPGAGTWPAALAVGDAAHCSGRAVLAAGVAGYECMTRVGKAVRPFAGPGHPVNGILSPLGAAAVTGNLLGISPQEMTMALSIAASHGAGLNEYAKTGGEVKRLHVGIGARAGIQSVLLSKEGLTGPATALEGEAGLVRTYAADPKIAEITRPSDTYAIMEAGIRLYPTVGLTTSSIEAIAAILRQRSFSHDQVVAIDVAVASWAKEHSGIVAIKDATGAQYSIPYSIALELVLGSQDLRHYYDEALWVDPRIVDVIGKVKFSPLAEATGDMRHSARMTVTLRDGSAYEAFVRHPKGSFLNPITDSEARDKFLSLAVPIIGDLRAASVIDAVDNIEDMRNVSDLIDLLCQNPRE